MGYIKVNDIEIEFSIIKNKDGEVIGLSVEAAPNIRSEKFCSTFHKLIFEKKACFLVDDERLILKISEPEKIYKIEVGKSNAESIKKFFDSPTKKVIKPSVASFKILLKGVRESNGEKCLIKQETG